MTKRKKFWLGFLTFLPILTVLLYLVSFFYMWIDMYSAFHNPYENEGMARGHIVAMILMFFLIFITIVAMIGIMIYYILHANKHFNEPNDNQKLIWILVLILAGGIGNVVYFLAVILPLKAEDQKVLQ